MYELMQQMVGTTHRMVGTTHELQSDMGELRDHMADFDDFWRPLRNYLYWEPHCFDIPMCWSIRSIFDGLDGIDEVTTKMQGLVKELDQLDMLMPQMLLQFPQMIATMQSTRTMMLTMHSTMSGSVHPDGRIQRQRHGHGQGVRRVEQRRLVLSAAGRPGEQGLPADHEDLPCRRTGKPRAC